MHVLVSIACGAGKFDGVIRQRKQGKIRLVRQMNPAAEYA